MSDDADLTWTVTPKSDQLNADDLIAGPRTIRIASVSVNKTPEQPVSVYYEGDDGRPWKPCLSMRRVLIALWGPKGSEYVGKRVTLYRDNSVTFGPMETGGIRVSHADVPADVKIALTATRGKRKLFVVKPLPPEEQKPASASAASLQELLQVLDSKGISESAARLTWVSEKLGRKVRTPKDILETDIKALKDAASKLP